jgi:hypothetical protein
MAIGVFVNKVTTTTHWPGLEGPEGFVLDNGSR